LLRLSRLNPNHSLDSNPDPATRETQQLALGN
jgi:hypothetical protein